MMSFPQIVTCACGTVKFKALAKPIATAVCYCNDCQSAGEMLKDFDNTKPFQDPDGGTAYVTLHDKNWVAIEGEDCLSPLKLKPDSPTTRYITTCCQSPMFLKFNSGFWISTYRARYVVPPPLEWRNKTSRRRSKRPYPDDIPRFKTFPLRLFGRLLKARLF